MVACETFAYSFSRCGTLWVCERKNHRDKQLRIGKTTSTCSSSSRSLPRRLGHWEHFAGCCHRYGEGDLRLLSPSYTRCEQKYAANLLCAKLERGGHYKTKIRSGLSASHLFPRATSGFYFLFKQFQTWIIVKVLAGKSEPIHSGSNVVVVFFSRACEWHQGSS